MLTKNGKVFCYINNFNEDIKISSDGSEDRCYVGPVASTDRNGDGSGYAVGVANYYRGNWKPNTTSDDRSSVCLRQACKSFHIRFSTNSTYNNVDTNYWTSNPVDDLSILFQGSYNHDYDEVSYINPVIMHATCTVKNNTSSTRRINVIELWIRAYEWSGSKFTLEGGSNSNDRIWSKLAFQILTTPVTLNPGDTATFTITVK